MERWPRLWNPQAQPRPGTRTCEICSIGQASLLPRADYHLAVPGKGSWTDSSALLTPDNGARRGRAEGPCRPRKEGP
eukprot:8098467-Pyramimonas_sp.AAC.1